MYRHTCFYGFFVILFCLSACAEATTELPPTPTLAASLTPSAVPTMLPTATSTPAPTLTPTATATLVPSPTAEPAVRQFGYPIGSEGQPPGLGFFIRHGYASENTWYNPGYWHTGEDWYAITGDTAGALVYAIAAGEVVYVGANYPGRVVIVRHPDGLFSMYGHLDPNVAVAQGALVERGSLLGTVLRRGDDVPNHLHFEVRTFAITELVNGQRPRYNFRCGVNCPPGPGYWPIPAPDHPSDQGWRNPTHVINGRSFAGGASSNLGQVIATERAGGQLELREAPDPAAPLVATVASAPGTPFDLLEISSGPEDSRAGSAEGYRIWYRIAWQGTTGWVQAAVADPFETGSDGRPSSVYFVIMPDG
jgi:murein DD-endopeptidase MepM/ murein hydrolase activator NlpD